MSSFHRGAGFVFVVVVAITSSFVSAEFAKGAVELTPDNFDSKVLKSDSPWIIAFYAPWCGHCKNLAPAWGNAATATKGIIPFGSVNADAHQSLGSKYGVEGFPTIKVFGDDKKSPTEYQGGRDAKSLIESAVELAQKVIEGRIGGSGRGSGSGGAGGSHVIQLTDSNFDKLVMQSEELWIVAFTAPWCGHCKRLEPEFARASVDMKGRAVRFGNLDATANQAMAQRFGIEGYPTIKVFEIGDKSDNGEDYNGGRLASDFVQFAEEELLKNAPAPEVLQMTNMSVFESDCQPKQLCFIAFLPLLQDSAKAGRDGHISTLQALAERYKRELFGWTWIEATVQASIETAFDVGGSGYPALVTVNVKKNKFATMRGQFSEKGISEFVNKVKAGRHPTQTLSEFPAIIDTEAWDGSEFTAPVYEEEFDLSELMDDDDEEDDSKIKEEL